MPGAVDLVAAVPVATAVASSSPRPLVDAALGAAEMAFDVVIAGDEVARPSPAPDLYAEACGRVGGAPGDAGALGDPPTGVASARAAGLFVIGVPSLPGIALE